jgi:hypothetical protein
VKGCSIVKANCDLTFLAFFHGVSEKGYTMHAKKETAGEERGAQLGDPRPPLSTTQNFPFTPPARDRTDMPPHPKIPASMRTLTTRV